MPRAGSSRVGIRAAVFMLLVLRGPCSCCFLGPPPTMTTGTTNKTEFTLMGAVSGKTWLRGTLKEVAKDHEHPLLRGQLCKQMPLPLSHLDGRRCVRLVAVVTHQALVAKPALVDKHTRPAAHLGMPHACSMCLDIETWRRLDTQVLHGATIRASPPLKAA